MICPRCKIPMNHHGDKPVDPRDAEEAKRVLPGLDGLIEEIHACWNCGAMSSRPGAAFA